MIKKLLLLLLPFCFSCKTLDEKKVASQASESYKTELLKAKSLSKTNSNLAIAKLNQLLSSNSENNLSDDALYLMGDLLYKSGNKKAAERSFSRILDSKYASPLDGQALLYKSKILQETSDRSSVLKALNYIDYNQLSDKKSIEKVELIRAPIFLQNQAYFKFLKSASGIISNTKDQNLARKVNNQALDVLKIKLAGYDSKRVLEDQSLKIFHPQAALNLTEYYFNNEQPESAIEVLETHASSLQSPVYKSKRDELIMRGQLFISSNNDVIGVLLPLTGKYQTVGNQILKGLQYSFSVWEKDQRTNFKLAILDSEGDPDQTSLAFDELMKKDKPVAIIGGLISKTAEALLKKSDKFKVPTLVLSQKEGLTKKSRYGFQSYQSLESYSAFLSAIAFEKAGFKKIAILQSNKAFSSRYGAAFKKSFESLGGEITDVIEYDLEERRALPNAVKKLVKLTAAGDRAKEYQEALRIWRKSSRSRGQTGIPKIELILKPRIDFDALFIADGAKNGGLVASTLAYFDVEDVPLIGTHLWNDNALVERGQRFVEGAFFADSYHKPELQASSCGQIFSDKFKEPISSYVYKGIEAGTILNSAYQGDKIDSRHALLSALMRTSTITDRCIPRGLIREQRNFTSSLYPLTVENKSIVPLNTDKITKKADESPDF